MLSDSNGGQELQRATIPRRKCLFAETSSAKFGPGLGAEGEVREGVLRLDVHKLFYVFGLETSILGLFHPHSI